MAGPVILSWSAAAATLGLQATTLTDWPALQDDCATLWNSVGVSLDPTVQLLAAFACLWAGGLGYSFLLMPSTFPAPVTEGRAVEVPRRSRHMPQHQLDGIDHSYVLLNSLCMPGLFYHFFTLMRTWGFDPGAPPLFGIYPPSASQLLCETAPSLAAHLSLYFLVYELVYYWWHRAMHEVPVLYTWVHRHHHQQTYPDRAALDTYNTGCVESQVGLYLQLGVLAGCAQLGAADLPAGIWFFTIAGYLSVLEHDKHDRSLPGDIWRADDHHMHHAYVKCNYSPYSTIWDRVFGTFKAFEVKQTPRSTTPVPQLANATSAA